MQAYADPRRESDPYALPDVEVFERRYRECPKCGDTIVADPTCHYAACHNCDDLVMRMIDVPYEANVGWFYWSCSPGCLPDSDPIGPFDTEEEALADARDGWEGGDDEA